MSEKEPCNDLKSQALNPSFLPYNVCVVIKTVLFSDYSVRNHCSWSIANLGNVQFTLDIQMWRRNFPFLTLYGVAHQLSFRFLSLEA